MKKMLLILSLGITFQSYNFTPNAVCIAPVADLLSFPIEHGNKACPFKRYHHLPCAETARQHIAPRLGQLLFNEQVQIMEKHGTEVKVLLSHLYSGAHKHHAYWTRSAYLAPLSDFSSNEKKLFPRPIEFKTKKISYNGNTVILKKPFHNKESGMTYSIGTRFLKTNDPITRGSYTVYAYNPDEEQFDEIKIPRSSALLDHKRSKSEQRKLFLSLMHEWAHQGRKAFPYVIGGASLVKPCIPKNYQLKKLSNGRGSFYIRPEKLNNVQTGIDCAHLIARAAQAAGIPYYASNTTAIPTVLRKMNANDTVEAGDVMIWKGHTAIISNIHPARIIESRGYGGGYGIVQEIPLKHLLKDMNTVSDLKTAYLKYKPIKLLDSKHEPRATIYDLRLYKLIS